MSWLSDTINAAQGLAPTPLEPGAVLDSLAEEGMRRLQGAPENDRTSVSLARARSEYPDRRLYKGVAAWSWNGVPGYNVFIWIFSDGTAVVASDHVASSSGFSLSDLDPTYSRGALGRAIGSTGVELVREAIGTAAVGLTGGLAAANSRIRSWAQRGYTTGAVVALTRSPLAGVRQAQANEPQAQPSGTGAFAPQAQLPSIADVLAHPLFVVGIVLLALLMLGGRGRRNAQ